MSSMTEVWKSIPRHFCKFCKCWIADNKPSRDFHEKGKNHQKNVELKITEVRKKASTDAKTKEEESGYFKQMEEAAKKAFLTDLKKDPKLAQQYLKKNEEKKKAAAKAKLKKENQSGGSQASEDSTTQETEGARSADDKSRSAGEAGTWRLTHSPEGYPYYWNDITGEVSWTLPEGVEVEESESGDTSKQPVDADTDDKPDSAETGTTSVTDSEQIVTTSQSKDKNSSKTDTSNGESVKNSKQKQVSDKKDSVSEASAAIKQKIQQACDFDLGDISCIPLPGDIPIPKLPATNDPLVEDSPEDEPQTRDKQGSTDQEMREGDPEEETSEEGGEVVRSLKRGHHSAYGQWETVQEEIDEPVDLELPQIPQKGEEKVIVVSEPKLKFREKKVDTLGADLVAFKKRKMNSRSLKQRHDK